jgi:hypothetical protein
MSQVAILHWNWQPAGPLVTGYSQNLAEAAGEIERGQRSVINLKTRGTGGELQPAFLASSVKGVFRTAAAWLVERTARQAGAQSYVTCDYGLAVPESWRPRLGIHKREDLCPVCCVFGGAGCLGESDVAPVTRRKSQVDFGFSQRDDAWHSQALTAPGTLFTWETISLLDVPYLSRLKDVLDEIIEGLETEDLGVDLDKLGPSADHHQVYERLRHRVQTEDISTLEDWAGVLTDDFPYPEMVELAVSLEAIVNSGDDLTDKRKLSIAAMQTTQQKIDKWLQKLKAKPPKKLVVEQLQAEPGTMLSARINPADDFAVALILLASDLVSSGFFRFGRFTSRGYGVVRLKPADYFLGRLNDLLSADEVSLQAVGEGQTGMALARELLGYEPVQALKRAVLL